MAKIPWCPSSLLLQELPKHSYRYMVCEGGTDKRYLLAAIADELADITKLMLRIADALEEATK